MNVAAPWLCGLFAVIPTPMQPDGGLDLASLDRLVDHYRGSGARGLVPASLAGEGDRLTRDERLQVIDRVVQRAGPQVPVLVGVLADATADALALGHEALARGARGLLVKPPRVPLPALQDHLRRLGAAWGAPMVLIDHPHYGPRLPVADLQALADAVPELQAVKLEEVPTGAKMAAVRARLGSRLALFGGLGGVHTLEELAAGAVGLFTGLPDAAALVRTLQAWGDGDLPSARAAFAQALPMALWEQQHPAQMIAQRKRLLQQWGVIEHAAVRAAA